MAKELKNKLVAEAKENIVKVNLTFSTGQTLDRGGRLALQPHSFLLCGS